MYVTFAMQLILHRTVSIEHVLDKTRTSRWQDYRPSAETGIVVLWLHVINLKKILSYAMLSVGKREVTIKPEPRRKG